MFRFAPALLVCLLVTTSMIWSDDAFPSLDQRLGRTITVIEKSQPTEKAIITQVWRLEDGTPCMQAQGQTSKVQMTLVENPSAKAAADRIKIHRWVNGVRPEGCPVPPTTTASAVKQTQYETPRTVVTSTTSDKVNSTEGGLMPVVPKKEEVVVVPPKVIRTIPSINEVPVTRTLPSVREVPPAPPVTPPATVIVRQPVSSAPAVIKTAPATTLPTTTVTTKTVQPPAAAQPATPAPATTAKPELVGGCEIVTVTENGVARKYKILGTSRDKHGVVTQRCQSLDNNEIVTLNCDSCTACAPSKPACPPVACTPAPVKCDPPKVVCAPAPVKCEPAKVVCAPVVTKTECKPCEPAKVACEPAKAPCDPAKTACDSKPCDNAANKGCDPCADKKACDSCKTHATLANGSGNDCGTFCQRQSLFDQSCRSHHCRDNFCTISVPVPGVRLNTVNGMPGGPPPQPLIPAFCTMNSTSVRCYMNAPQIVPFMCLNPPFSNCMNAQITAGIFEQNGVNGEAVANTMHLINVLAQSKEWENRQWAAQRLQQATLPTVRPYVEDALMAAAQGDRAPMVKVSAMRTLAGMNSTRPDVLAMLAYAAEDADPRIKEAAREAMTTLAKTNGVQQAGYNK